METQNVTLALPKELLRRAKIAAAQRNASLSALMRKALEDLIEKEDQYEQARTRSLSLLERGIDMETRGAATWTRDELYDR